MERRTLLRQVGVAGALGLAGCLPTANSTDPGDDGSPDDTPESGIVVTNATVQTLGGECASGDEATADVTFDEDGSVIAIAGVVTAGTPCHDVALKSVEYDPDEEQLAVSLRTERRDEPCVECVGAVEFEATVEVDGGLPATVEVLADDTRLASERRDEQSPDDESPVLGDASFEVVETTPASGEPEADVTFDGEAGEVRATGTIHGSDGCKTAALRGVDYDRDADEVTLFVVTEDRPGSEDRACTQAIVAITYEATVSFDGGVPRTATVVHDGEAVVSGAHDSARVSEENTGERNTTDG